MQSSSSSRFHKERENEERPNQIDITTGSLAEPEHFRPSKDVFAEEKLSW
jgi:hypothetical protein